MIHSSVLIILCALIGGLIGMWIIPGVEGFLVGATGGIAGHFAREW